MLEGQVKLMKDMFKSLASYKTIEPPITKAMGLAQGKLDDLRNVTTEAMKNLGIQDASHWVVGAMEAFLPALESIAEFTMPKTKQAMQGCIDARRVLAKTARTVAAKLGAARGAGALVAVGADGDDAD